MITDDQLSFLVYDLIWTLRPTKQDLWLRKGINRVPREGLVAYWRKKSEVDPDVSRSIRKAYRKYLADTALRDEHLSWEAHISFVKEKTQVPLSEGETNSIGWIITCFNETDYVAQCLQSIRKHDSGPILLINDGGNPEGLQEIADSVNAIFVNGERLKTLRDGHNWWKRFFTLGWDLGTDFLVKLDPDSYFWRPLSRSLRGLTFFGTTTDFDTRNKYSVQGGVQGFSREYAKQVLAHDKLDRPRRKGTGLDGVRFTTDGYLCDLNEELKVFGEEWREVKSVYALRQDLPPSDPGEFAITHPHSLGASEVSKDTRSRLSTCYLCSSFDVETRICKESEKYIYPITKIPEASCPLGKWDLPPPSPCIYPSL